MKCTQIWATSTAVHGGMHAKHQSSRMSQAQALLHPIDQNKVTEAVQSMNQWFM